MHVLLPAAAPQEGHHHQARHVVRGDTRSDERQDTQDDVAFEGGLDDVVLGVVARGERETDDGQIPHRKGQEGPPHRPGQGPEVAHVHVVVHAVHHGPGAEEHVRLEEAVGDQVEDREGRTHRPETRGQHHVADLRHGGTGQDLLDVVLGGADPGAGEQRHDTHDRHREGRGLADLIDRVAAHHQVDTRRDHRGRVDQGGDRGGALHGVEQPRLQRHLRRLAARREQQQETEQRRGGDVGPRHAGVDLGEGGAAEKRQHRENGHRHSQVTDAVDDERLASRGSRGGFVLPEGDQQVGGQADALPAEEQHQVAVGQHQREHRRDEQVQVGEEPAAPLVVGHVADRVDVDQRSDAGDEQHEQDRQLVDQHPEAEVPGPGVDPVVEVNGDGPLPLVSSQHRTEQQHPDGERGQTACGRQPVTPRVGKTPEDQQQRRPGQGNHDQEPGEAEQPRCGYRRHGFQQQHDSLLRTSAGSRRRRRPSDGRDRRRR